MIDGTGLVAGSLCAILKPYPLPGLVFEEGSYHGVEGVDVPGLVHKVDPSKSGRKTVLLEKRQQESYNKKKNQVNQGELFLN